MSPGHHHRAVVDKVMELFSFSLYKNTIDLIVFFVPKDMTFI